MEQSPQKRRDISPPSSYARNGDKRPKLQDGSRISERRASFMSPTKASLAKFNPDLLQKIDVNLLSPSKRNGKKLNLTALSPRRDKDLSDTTYDNNINGLPNDPPHSRRSLTRHQQDEGANNEGQDGLRAIAPSNDEVSSEGAHMKNNLLTPTRRVAPDEAVQENDEPSLPSTPSQLGLEAPAERPKGLLFGTPSRRSRKKPASSSNSTDPSPLKNHEGASNQVTEPTPSLDLGPKIWLLSAPVPPLSAMQASLQQEQRNHDVTEKDMLETTAQVLKEIILSKWLKSGARSRKIITRKRKKLSLLLEAFRQSYESLESLRISAGADVASTRSPASLGSTEIPNSASGLADDLAEKLCLFLPFSGIKTTPASSVPPTSNTNTDSSGQTQSDYQASPCTVQIHQSRTLPVTAEGLVPQKHEVVFSSTSEPTLQLGIILLTVDSKSLTILSAKPLSVHPWSTGELYNFIRVGLAGKNPTALGTAVGRYWQVVQLRTHCWKSIREHCAHLDVSCNADAGAAAAADPDDGTTTVTIRRVDNRAVALSVEWTIGFDKESGDVQSRVSAVPSFPSSWRGGEFGGQGGNVLDRVGEAFDAMVRTRGVREAVEVMVALLFPFD